MTRAGEAPSARGAQPTSTSSFRATNVMEQPHLGRAVLRAEVAALGVEAPAAVVEDRTDGRRVVRWVCW